MFDPVCTIFYVAILSFKTKGTKLSIQNSAIQIQTPSMFQGIERWKSGCHRNELLQLSNPIIFFIQQYWNDSTTVRTLLHHIKNGILNLKDTYEDETGDLVSESLKLYIAYLENPCKIFKNSELPRLNFQRVWNEKELDVCTNLLDLCFENRTKPDIVAAYINILEKFLNLKNQVFQDFDTADADDVDSADADDADSADADDAESADADDACIDPDPDT